MKQEPRISTKGRSSFGRQNSFKLRSGQIKFQTLVSFAKKNYFLLIFVACIGFVGLVAFYKLFISKPTYVYTKVKVGQGMWWATTQRPNLWFVRAIQQAKEQKDLTGKPVAKILDVSYYPYFGSGQYDIYLTLQLKVSKVGSTGTYNFNRATIGVGSAIDLEFPNTQFSGTILALSEHPFKETYVTKVIYLYKKAVNPWEYDQIQVGDYLFNGKERAFEILSKEKGPAISELLGQLGGQMTWDTQPYQYVQIKAKIRVKKEDNQYVFGEEYVLSPGRTFPVSLNDLTLNDYIITKVQ